MGGFVDNVADGLISAGATDDIKRVVLVREVDSFARPLTAVTA